MAKILRKCQESHKAQFLRLSDLVSISFKMLKITLKFEHILSTKKGPRILASFFLQRLRKLHENLRLNFGRS